MGKILSFTALVNHLNHVEVRMEDESLNKDSIDFASGYIQEWFPNGEITQRHLVLNGLAHGYYMGYRRAEVVHGRRYFKKKGPHTREELESECDSASDFYIKERFAQALLEDQRLIRMAIWRGFRHGVLKYES